jgi:GNAT superfamily N-acetyltransferase
MVLTEPGEAGSLVAIAHYRNDPQSNFAEAAFLVLDEWQAKGIGTALMSALVDTALKHGIAGFTAEVLATNHGMIRTFHKCGFPVESRLEEGVFHLRIPFNRRRRQRGKPEPDQPNA